MAHTGEIFKHKCSLWFSLLFGEAIESISSYILKYPNILTRFRLLRSLHSVLKVNNEHYISSSSSLPCAFRRFSNEFYISCKKGSRFFLANSHSQLFTNFVMWHTLRSLFLTFSSFLFFPFFPLLFHSISLNSRREQRKNRRKKKISLVVFLHWNTLGR